MDSILSAYQDHKQNTMDSFEINLKQIEQTNKLLDNIEFKLTDFFAKKSLNENFLSLSDSNHKNYDLPKALPIDSFISRRLSGSPDSTQKRISIQTQKILEDRSSGLLTFGTAEQLKNHLKTSATDHLNHHFSKPICDDRFHSGQSQQRLSAHDDPRSRASVRNDSSDRMLELEDCYQSKIGLLQNRIKASETEYRKMKDENKKLSLELNTIRKTIGLSREQFLEELKNALYEQEVRLAQDFMGKLAAQEDIIAKMNQEISRLVKANGVLKGDCDALFAKNEKLVFILQDVEKEKVLLQEKYQNLMSIQNEMIQQDVQRNGRFSNDTSSFLHFSNQKEAKEVEKNKFDESKNEIRVFVENIELYRRELDELKCNNLQIKEQFHIETDRIKADLKQQKAQNGKLIEQLRQQQIMNQKLAKTVQLQSKTTMESLKEKYTSRAENSDEGRKDVLSKIEKSSSRGTLREIYEHAKENVNTLNTQERGLHGGEIKELVETINDSANFPFTNPQIKSGWSKGRKSVPRLGGTQEVAPKLEQQQQNNKRKEHSKPKTERQLNRVNSKPILGGTLEEELRKLKAHVNARIIPEEHPPRRLSVKLNSNTARTKSSKRDEPRRSVSAPRKRLY